MDIFKVGDKVRMFYDGSYHHGEITIIKDGTAKVLFEELNYDYYPLNKLELLRPEHFSDLTEYEQN